MSRKKRRLEIVCPPAREVLSWMCGVWLLLRGRDLMNFSLTCNSGIKKKDFWLEGDRVRSVTLCMRCRSFFIVFNVVQLMILHVLRDGQARNAYFSSFLCWIGVKLGIVEVVLWLSSCLLAVTGASCSRIEGKAFFFYILLRGKAARPLD